MKWLAAWLRSYRSKGRSQGHLQPYKQNANTSPWKTWDPHKRYGRR